MVPLGLEPMTFCVKGRRDNHCSMEPLFFFLFFFFRTVLSWFAPVFNQGSTDPLVQYRCLYLCVSYCDTDLIPLWNNPLFTSQLVEP